MNVKISPQTHDAIDRDEYKRMIESEPFKLLMSRIQTEYRRNAEVCLDEDNHVLLARAQGAANALAMALMLPQKILTEMSNKSPK
jgi:hypothetical protein